MPYLRCTAAYCHRQRRPFAARGKSCLLYTSKLGEDIAGSLQLQIEELAATIDGLRQQAEESGKETKEALTELDKRLTAVENGWGINYNHDAVLGLCYMGAAWLSQHYERTEETAVLGVA